MAGFLGSVLGQIRLDVRQAVAAYATVRAENARTLYALRGSSDAFITSGQNMALAGGGMVYAIGQMVTAAAEFERKMDFFGAVSGATADQLDQVSKYALKLAQDTIYSADQIAEGLIELGKAGVTTEQIMNGVGEAMTSLGAAADIPLDQAGQIIISTLSQFEQEADQASRMVDILAGAANASIADITDLGVSLKYAGGIANQNNQTFEDTATALALLANAGIRGSTAGTSLRQMLVSLPGVTGPAQKALKTMGILTEDGSNKFYDMQGNLKPLPQVFQILQNSLKGFSNEQKTVLLRQLFNNRALGAAVTLTNEGAKGFDEMWEAMSHTKAADVAAARLDNLSGDIEILKGNIQTLMIQSGGPFQETLRGWVQALTKLVQAYGRLPESTQKAIVQSIAYVGVALLVMGAINILIGSIIRFIGFMIRFGAAMKFLWKAGGTIIKVFTMLWKVLGKLRAAFTALRVIWLAVSGAMGGGGLVGILAAIPVWGWIALAIIGLIAAFVLLYKKVAPFRDFINKYVVEPVKLAAKFIWDNIQKIISYFQQLGDSPGEVLRNLGADIASFAGQLVQSLLALPGRILGALAGLFMQLASIFTFRNLGRIAGMAMQGIVNLIVARFILLPAKLLAIALQVVAWVARGFAQLAPRIGYWIGFAIGYAIRLWLQFQQRMWSLAARLVTGIIRFLISLPGRVRAIFIRMTVAIISAVTRAIAWVIANGPRIARGLINGIQSLPSRIGALMARALSAILRFIPRAIAAAQQFGRGFLEGVTSAISGLPGLVSGIVGQCIAAFQGAISSAFSAAKGFAGGLWEGFKDGLGINSPSFIEKHMFQMNDTMAKETKALAKQTMDIQRLGKKWVANSIGTTGGGVSPVDVAGATARVAAKMTPGTPTVKVTQDSQKGVASSRMVQGQLTLDRSGRAFISGVAEDEDDLEADYQDTLDRMNP